MAAWAGGPKGAFVQFRVMPRTIGPEPATAPAPGRAALASAAVPSRVRSRGGARTVAQAATLAWPVFARAEAALGAAGGSGFLWLFLAVAFAGSALAFFSWGRLSARSAARPTDVPGAGEELTAAERAVKAPPPSTAAPASADAPGQRLPAPPAAPGTDAWLQAWPGVAVVARRSAEGCRVEGLNPAARAQWPRAMMGTPIEALAGVGPPCRAAIESLAPGAAISFDGWRMVALTAEVTAEANAEGREPAGWVLLSQAAVAADADPMFGSTLSHDLRAPIRVVEGFTRIVKEDYGALLDRVGNDHLDRVLGAAARMNLMIDALLTMARLSAQPLARQPVDLSQLAQFVVEDLRRSDPARDVEVDIEPGLAASGDPTLLRLVLENLLGNAWKYTARADSPRIAVRAVQHEGRRAIAVQDNGAGFDMRSADRLFGLFQRLHSASDFPGHGVGLASVRRIVGRHGGDIWAEGRPGHGATFTFTLG
jgi:signal transduction histidine kinase